MENLLRDLTLVRVAIGSYFMNRAMNTKNRVATTKRLKLLNLLNQPPNQRQQRGEIMGKHFKEFCDKQRKDKNGHVADAIDMSTENKDAAVVAALRDDGMLTLACAYGAFSEDRKNSVYQSYEWIIRDMIDKYNLAVDIQNESLKITPSEQLL